MTEGEEMKKKDKKKSPPTPPPLSREKLEELANAGQLRPSFFCDSRMAKVAANNAGR